MPESIREKYKKETGKEPLTKAGAKTKDYESYLLSPECTVPWYANWSFLYKKNKESPYKTKEALMTDLKEKDRVNRLGEKCVRGGVGRGEQLKETVKFRRESKEKYDIENY